MRKEVVAVSMQRRPVGTAVHDALDQLEDRFPVGRLGLSRRQLRAQAQRAQRGEAQRGRRRSRSLDPLPERAFAPVRAAFTFHAKRGEDAAHGVRKERTR